MAQKVAEQVVTEQPREILDAEVTLVTEKELTIDANVSLEVHHNSIPIKQLLEQYTEKFMDQSRTRQDELLSVATKIKIRRNQKIVQYITKHRILRNDMVDANCMDVVHGTKEEMTVQYIIQGLRNIPEWAPICTTMSV